MAYDDYFNKHCARYYGWLPASKEHKLSLNNKPLKYFTLSAEEAIDIFMLEKEGVLQRDKNGELPGVIICEKNTGVASKIFSLVRPPLKEAIFVGGLDIILTFKDDAHTRKVPLDFDEDVKDRNLRLKLNTRRSYERLKKNFPFDIINFDPYGNMLNKEKDTNKRLLESFRKVFELQSPLHSFLMFVTIPTSDIHVDFLNHFRQNFEENVKDHEEVAKAVKLKFKSVKYNDIAEQNQLAIGFAKSFISPLAKDFGWQCEHKGIYIYENDQTRHMLSSVILFSKTDSYQEDLYIKDVVRVISEMPNYYPYKKPFRDKKVIDHIQDVIEYRENLKVSFI